MLRCPFQTFRRLLIAKLQDEFENRNKKLDSLDSKEGSLTAEEEEQRARAKQHMLGNIKFIGSHIMHVLFVQTQMAASTPCIRDILQMNFLFYSEIREILQTNFLFYSKI